MLFEIIVYIFLQYSVWLNIKINTIIKIKSKNIFRMFFLFIILFISNIRIKASDTVMANTKDSEYVINPIIIHDIKYNTKEIEPIFLLEYNNTLNISDIYITLLTPLEFITREKLLSVGNFPIPYGKLNIVLCP